MQAFDTSMIPAQERLDAAIDCYCRIGRMDVEPRGGGFGFSAAIYRSPLAAVGKISVSPCLATRTRSHAAEGNEYDVIGIATGDAPVEVRLPGHETFFYSAGEAFLWTGDQSGTSVYHGASNGLINIAIPRATLQSAFKDLSMIAGRPLPASAQFRLLTHIVSGFLREAEGLPVETRSITMQHVVDLALVALGAGGDVGQQARLRGVRAVRLQAIKADIEASLRDIDLSVAAITSRHHLSERSLRALFEQEGTSFRAYVLGRRLALALRLLRDPQRLHLPVSEIAYASGFSDLSWFNRSFRRRFAMTPSEARETFFNLLDDH